MEVEITLQKAQLLLDQNRYDEAKTEVESFLSFNPTNIEALVTLVQVHLGLNQNELADQVIDNVIQQDPSNFYTLYLKGVTQANLGNEKSALKFVNNALAYNPTFSAAYGLKSMILFKQAKFEEALASANDGLETDAQNEMCLNQRSRALLKLGRNEERLESDKQALKSNPLNPDTHATVGYSELEKGNEDAAKKHFREALRLDPTNEYARYGMLQAIKSSNFFYRLFLRYVFWMEGISSRMRWVVIIVGYLLIRGIQANADQMGSFQPFAEAIVSLYMIFAISTWIIGPVSNVFLRFHSFGKFVLSDSEKKAANLCAALMGLAIFGAFVMYKSDADHLQLQNLGIYMLCSGIALTVVVSAIDSCSLEKSKRNLKMAGIVFAVLCGALIFSGMILPVLAISLFNWLIWGFLGFQFYANSQG